MSSALGQPVTIARGEDVSLQFTVTPTPTDGLPRAYGFQVKTTAAALATEVAMVDESGAYDPATGIVTVALDHETTAAIEPGVYFYWLWRTDADSERRVADGAFKVVSGGRY